MKDQATRIETEQDSEHAEDGEQLVYAFAKNSRETVRVGLTEYHGRPLISLRVFYGGLPTRKGITLGRDLLPELEAAVVRLRAATTASAVAAR